MKSKPTRRTIDIKSAVLREQSPCCDGSMTEKFGLLQCDGCGRAYSRYDPNTKDRKAFEK